MRNFRAGKSSFLLALILVIGILPWIHPHPSLAYYGASAQASGQTGAAALDVAMNGDAAFQVRLAAGSGRPGEKVSAAVTFTNPGTIPGQLCLEPPAQAPNFLRVLTGKTCLPDFKPQAPVKMTLEWEILNGAPASYELKFQVSLVNGFVIAKELIFSGQVASTPTPTATSTPTRTSTATLTPIHGGGNGTSLSARISATGFYEKVAVTLAPTATGTPANTATPTPEPRFSYGVRGEICVTNTGSQTTELLSVFVLVEAREEKGQFKPVNGAALAIPVDRELAPRETRCFSYRIEFDPQKYKAFRSSAQAVILNHSGWLPRSKNCPGPAACPFGPTIKADFTLPQMATATPTATATSTPSAAAKARAFSPTPTPPAAPAVIKPGEAAATYTRTLPAVTLTPPPPAATLTATPPPATFTSTLAAPTPTRAVTPTLTPAPAGPTPTTSALR